MHHYFVYILKCADESYYTGITNDLDRRLYEHQTGLHPSAYTHTRRPVALVFYTEFKDVNQAIDFEKQVKGMELEKERSDYRRPLGFVKAFGRV